ncbi:hypothetical protein HK096_004404, partial [Nowakowskiella sp. JEL0078]
ELLRGLASLKWEDQELLRSKYGSSVITAASSSSTSAFTDSTDADKLKKNRQTKSKKVKSEPAQVVNDCSNALMTQSKKLWEIKNQLEKIYLGRKLREFYTELLEENGIKNLSARLPPQRLVDYVA